MARVVKLVSDITGTEANEDEFIKCVIRTHPKSDEAKSLDVLPGELDSLNGVSDLVVIELGSNGDKSELVVSYKDFVKLVKDEVVQNAPGTRGRRPGWSPKG
jgi:hypothetical protein